MVRYDRFYMIWNGILQAFEWVFAKMLVLYGLHNSSYSIRSLHSLYRYKRRVELGAVLEVCLEWCIRSRDCARLRTLHQQCRRQWQSKATLAEILYVNVVQCINMWTCCDCARKRAIWFSGSWIIWIFPYCICLLFFWSIYWFAKPRKLGKVAKPSAPKFFEFNAAWWIVDPKVPDFFSGRWLKSGMLRWGCFQMLSPAQIGKFTAKWIRNGIWMYLISFIVWSGGTI